MHNYPPHILGMFKKLFTCQEEIGITGPYVGHYGGKTSERHKKHKEHAQVLHPALQNKNTHIHVPVLQLSRA